MKLLLATKKCIKDLNREIAKRFPNLKLHFYTSVTKVGPSFHFGSKIADNTLLDKLVENFKPLVLEVHPWDTVAYLQQVFENELGLFVQVFRRSGNDWLETRGTEHLTLETQNNMTYENWNFHFNINTLYL
ncbi:MAG TPA: hypothetical protein VFQ73_10120 [Flavisolibacter sp.]|nr:hypothetical protein [Flavisolibacter sp.]